MVSLQVIEVKKIFEKVEVLRQNDWISNVSRERFCVLPFRDELLYCKVFLKSSASPTSDTIWCS